MEKDNHAIHNPFTALLGSSEARGRVLPESKKLSKRAEIIEQFVIEINKERVGSKYPLVTGRMIAIKLSHLKVIDELFYFMSICRDAKRRGDSFSRCFWGKLK